MNNDANHPEDDARRPRDRAEDSADAELKQAAASGQPERMAAEEQADGPAEAREQSTVIPANADTKPAIGFTHGAFPSHLAERPRARDDWQSLRSCGKCHNFRLPGTLPGFAD